MATWAEACPLEGVCPECGLGVRWVEVLRPQSVPPGWSVEHSPEPVKAAARGLLRSVLPWRLWGNRAGRLHMALELVPGRLWAALGAVCVLMWLTAGLVNLWMSAAIEATHPSTTILDTVTTILHPERPVQSYGSGLVYYRFAPMLVGLAALPAAFCLMPQTLARRRVRRLHLIRIQFYAIGPVIPFFVMVLVGRAFANAGAWGMLGQQQALAKWTGRLSVWATYMDDRPYVWAVLLAIWMLVFWWLALERYLRLPAALLTATLVVLLTALLSVVIVGFWPGSPLLMEIDAFFRGWV